MTVLRRTLALALALAAFALAALPGRAAAQAPELVWSERWARVHPASYVAQTTGAAAALVFDQAYVTPDDATVTGPLLFDAAVRNALRAPTHEGRELAASISDVLLLAMLAWPIVDPLISAGIVQNSPDPMWQLWNIATEVIAADFILSTLIKAAVHRERPHGTACTRADRTEHPGRCGRRQRTRSFYSGHASAVFSYAGAICMAHAHLPLWGDAGADAFACGSAIGLASVVSLLRILADRHYATDVLTGAIVGLATGLVLPYVLHFGWDRSETLDEPPVGATAPLGEAPVSFPFSGSF